MRFGNENIPLPDLTLVFSSTYKTASRIDLAFAKPTMMSNVLGASYLPSGLLDHCPLAPSIRSPCSHNSALWRLGYHWVTHPDLADTIPPLLMEYWAINSGSSSPEVTWDAFKAFTPGQYISSIAVVHKEQATVTTTLQDAVKTHTKAYNTNPTETQFDLLHAKKCKLHLYLAEVTVLDLYNNKQRFFEEGDHNRRLLAMLAQQEQPLTLLPKIRTTSGD